ncbi:MAG TPA: hypothetical protein GXZ79_05460 [Acholeplasma sp.]|nr:hypothetical protein [Acholeplasma sp.]
MEVTMREKEIVKNTYEAPVIEVIEFDLSDSIAASVDGFGAMLGEELWSNE